MGLTDAADWVRGNGARIQSWVEDDTGRVAFRTSIDGQDFLVAAKQYLHKNDASVMRRLAQRAAAKEMLILLWIDRTGDRLVFDPQTILDHGDDRATRDDSRQARRERWIDFPAAWAADLSAWVDGHDEPIRPGSIGQRDTSTTLDDFGGDR